MREITAFVTEVDGVVLHLKKRPDDWHCCVGGDESRWSSGITVEAAMKYTLEDHCKQPTAETDSVTPLSLDVSMERTRALRRICRALNDGDCPQCHRYNAATSMIRDRITRTEGIHRYSDVSRGAIECPVCNFHVTGAEIVEIEQLCAPAMDAAVTIFEEWRASRIAAEPDGHRQGKHA